MALFSLSAIFRNVHNLVLKNKKIGSAFARQPHHVLVVILDPPAHGLTVHQLHADRLLFLAQSLEEISFFESLFRGRGPAALGGVGISLRAERHRGIVHGATLASAEMKAVCAGGRRRLQSPLTCAGALNLQTLVPLESNVRFGVRFS